jgi:hypothetical protein
MTLYKNQSDGQGGRKLVPYTAEEEAEAVERTASHVPDTPARAAARKVASTRANQNPAIGDQLDVIWKQFAEDKRLGKTPLPETEAMLAVVAKVKADNPKAGE